MTDYFKARPQNISYRPSRPSRPSIPAPPKRLPPKSPFTLVKFNTPPVLSFNTQLSGSLLNMNAWPSLSIASGQSLNRPA